MDTLINWFFDKPDHILTLLYLIVAVGLFVILFRKLMHLWHLKYPPPIPDTIKDVGVRHYLGLAAQVDRQMILANYQGIALSELTFRNSAERLISDTELLIVLADRAMRTGLPPDKYAEYQPERLKAEDTYKIKELEELLKPRVKALMDDLEAKHHLKMKTTDIDIRKLAYELLKEMQKNGVSG